MVAEYTNEHLGLFEEDKEAMFFKNDEELLYKVQGLLSSPNQRNAIAENGRQRCLNSGYSNNELATRLIHEINSIK